MSATPLHRTVRLDAHPASAGVSRVDAGPLLLMTLATLLWALWSAVNTPPAGSEVHQLAQTPAVRVMSISGAATHAQARFSDHRLRTPNPEVAALTDEQITERLLGNWTTKYHGVQSIENRSDRSARLEIDFDWIAAFFYGKRMQLDLRWKVEHGVLTNHIERGEPHSNVDRLIADYSRTCSYLVLELGPDSLLLQEINDPDSFHRWTRIR